MLVLRLVTEGSALSIQADFLEHLTHLLMGLNVHSNLLRMIRDGGKLGGWVPVSFHLLTALSPPE